MTPTIKSDWFTQTSNEPYDRHYYTLNNRRFDDYELLRAYWFQIHITNHVVTVHDVQKRKQARQSPSGFSTGFSTGK